MPGYRRIGQLKGFNDLTCAQFLVFKQGHDAQAGVITQGFGDSHGLIAAANLHNRHWLCRWFFRHCLRH